jgi:hypothetical protein
MKTSFKSILCALALSTSVAFAGPGSDCKKPTNFETGIYKSKNGNLNVSIDKQVTAYASVTLLSAKGDVLAREGVGRKQQKASFVFDVSALPDGEYALYDQQREVYH